MNLIPEFQFHRVFVEPWTTELGSHGLMALVTFDFLDESGRSSLEIADMASEFLAVAIDQNEGGITLHVVLLLEIVVLLLHGLGLLLAIRKIDLHQNQLLVGELLKGLLIEGILLHLDAPTAPIRTGEIEQDGLAVLLGRSLGGREVGLPTRGGEI